MSKADLIAQLRKDMEAIASSEPRVAFGSDAPSVGKHHPNEFDEGLSKTKSATQAESGSRVAEEGQRSAFKKIVDLLAASDKSEAALRERLERAEFDHQDIDEAIARAKELGFVDDRRYADAFVRSRVAQGKGSAGIERDLKAHNIDPFILDGWPHAYSIDDDSELDRALAFLHSRPPKSKNLRESAYRKLVSRGYPSAVCARAARIWSEEQKAC
jgi:regulatory protein